MAFYLRANIFLMFYIAIIGASLFRLPLFSVFTSSQINMLEEFYLKTINITIGSGCYFTFYLVLFTHNSFSTNQKRPCRIWPFQMTAIFELCSGYQKVGVFFWVFKRRMDDDERWWTREERIWGHILHTTPTHSSPHSLVMTIHHHLFSSSYLWGFLDSLLQGV